MNTEIAIVGMACRYPDAGTPEELWETVLARRRAFRLVPEERLRLSDYSPHHDTDPDAIYPIEAAVLENYVFDRARYRIPASAFAVTDLTHWLALDVATEALADAGLAGGGDRRNRTGVIVGNTLTGEFSRAGLLRLRWPYVQRHIAAALAAERFDKARRTEVLARIEESYKQPFPAPNEESLAGGLSNTIAGRICNYYDLKGGGFTVDGACASSLLAVASACSRLACGEVDVVLAGGVDLSIDPFELVGFARNGALSRSIMRVFDARSDGFWLGEGCGFVVLMRESDARDAGHPVRAVIRGWGLSSDGQGGLTRPTVEGQAAALERAYTRAGFDVGSVAYFEAHGTGTAIGDPIEITAIADMRRAAGAHHSAFLGSIKANIGHTKAAAGVAGLIKTVMALDRQVLPATTACDDPHPAVRERSDVISVLQESRVWPAEWALRAGVSAMGFGGINVHLALEGPASRRRTTFDACERRLLASEQDAELFAFSASDRGALRQQIEAIAVLAPRLSRAELADAAAALARRLTSESERAMAVASSPVQLADRLRRLLEYIDRTTEPLVDPKGGIAISRAVRPRILFLFPGQAAPAHRAGGSWRCRFREIDRLYATANLPVDHDETLTEIAQPAIVTASLAGLLMLERLQIEGAGAVGHSLGELTALHWAGAFDAATLARIVRSRGKIMTEQALADGAMLLVASSPEDTRLLLGGGDAVIACYNGPRECVVAGAEREIAEILARARQHGIASHRLAVSHAFHSPFIEPAVAALTKLVASEPTAPLQCPVFSTITGEKLPADAALPELLGRQLVAPVRFAEALAQAAQDTDLMIEVGPGQGLTRIAASIAGPPAIALDAAGTSVAGLLLAAGAAFVLGAPVPISVLFDDRFVRPFDLDRPRRFLASPCENAPVGDYPSTRTEIRPASAAQPAKIVTRATPLDVVRAAVARRLELPVDAIEDGYRLLTDLHLNSITVGQLAAEASHVLGLSPPETPTNFATATVGEMAGALERCAAPPSNHGEIPPAGVDRWVRAFVPEFVERAVGRPERRPPRHWQVFAEPDHPAREMLPQELTHSGESSRAVAICLPERPDSKHITLLLDGARLSLDGDNNSVVLIIQHGGGGAGFARCLSLEAPWLCVRVVDLPFDHTNAATWIAAEAAAATPGYGEAHYGRDGVRRIPLLRALPQDPQASNLVGLLGPQDVILASGGGKGIGAECARALVQRTGARLGIIGRSSCTAPEVAANLDRLRAAGIIVAYETADVTDGTSVSTAIGRLVRTLGPITVVIHAAGVNQPLLLRKLDVLTACETVAVKINGARNIVAALGTERLRFFVGFGSIISRTGMQGEAHYALANEWLGQFVEEFAERHPSCHCLTVEWSVWSGIGMGEKLGAVEALARRGIVPLPINEANKMFEDLLANALQHKTVVVASRFGDPPTIDLARPTLPVNRFLERVPVFYPGIELIAEADLGMDADPYLADHCLGGLPLFPAVLGLEAMVQAASALAGGQLIEILEAVEFRRPVSVGTQGSTLRVAALFRDSGCIETVLRSDESGFQFDHFRALARLAPVEKSQPPIVAILAEPIALDPDLVYRRLLFHSGRFRRIAAYFEVSATSCVARLRPADGDRWFPRQPSDILLLGDPGIRDAALHSLQVCIPHRRVLPVAVRRILPGRLCLDHSYMIHAQETEHTGDRFTFDIEIRDAAGIRIERWEGLTLQALEVLPLPERLPVPLAVSYLERRLGELLPWLSLRLRLGDGGGSVPSSETVIGPALVEGQKLHRRPDGRLESGQNVSASHSGTLTLAVAASGAIGCDIEAVVPRAEAVWQDLLGAEHFALARLAARDGKEDLTCSATRVWAAVEALKKAGTEVAHAPLTLERIEDEWMTFTASSFIVASWVGEFDRSPAVAVAIAVAGRKPSVAILDPLASTREKSAPSGIPATRDDVQPAYSYRHVVGFSDTNLVGNVYFVNHIEWQGRCREMFLRDKAPSVIKDLARGLALVTTRCSCEYIVELNAFDEVRIEMRLKAMKNNRLVLAFKYWCCRDGSEELAAIGEQELACLRLVDGRSVPAPIPVELEAALLPYGQASHAIRKSLNRRNIGEIP